MDSQGQVGAVLGASVLPRYLLPPDLCDASNRYRYP